MIISYDNDSLIFDMHIMMKMISRYYHSIITQISIKYQNINSQTNNILSRYFDKPQYCTLVDLSDITCFVPSHTMCASLLSAGRLHPGQGPDDVSCLLTPSIFRAVEIQVKFCTNKDCKAMHQVWPINQGKLFLIKLFSSIIVNIQLLIHYIGILGIANL